MFLNYLRPQIMSPSNKRHKNQNFRGNIVLDISVFMVFDFLYLLTYDVFCDW